MNFLRDLVSLQLALAIETILVKYVWAQQSVWSFNAKNVLKTVISYVICLEHCGPSADEPVPHSTAVSLKLQKIYALDCLVNEYFHLPCAQSGSAYNPKTCFGIEIFQNMNHFPLHRVILELFVVTYSQSLIYMNMKYN